MYGYCLKMVNAFSGYFKNKYENKEEGKESNQGRWTTEYILVLCALWYASSCGANIVGKLLLQDFPYPISVALFHAFSLSIFVSPFLCGRQEKNEALYTKKCLLMFILPLAAGKFLSSYLSLFSIARIPISYSSTGKYSWQHQ